MNTKDTIETERLILTPWEDTAEDAKGLFMYAKDPDVGPHAGWKPHESEEESREILRDIFITSGYAWAIREKASGRIVGNISLEPDNRRDGVNSKELGYSLAKDCWGKGYMTEAAKAVINYGFEKLNLVIMAIFTAPVNKRSQRVIEKCGFTYEGTIRMAYHTFIDVDRDSMGFSMTRAEWEELKKTW